MPNWCSNTLSVSAESEKEILYFMEKLQCEDEQGNVQDFTFHSLVPRPKNEEEDWYNWNIENWGTKWDVDDVAISVEEDVVYFNFDTAWSPPEQWIKKVAPMFPNLTFALTYHEGGMGFAGKLCMQGNEIFDDYSVGTGDEQYWDIATENMTDREIEDNAFYTIRSNALDYWTYSFEDLVKYVGEANREKLYNLIMVQKLTGQMDRSSQDEFYGSDIEEIIEELIGVENFFQMIFYERKERKELKQLAA
jgi:hypothetical protein